MVQKEYVTLAEAIRVLTPLLQCKPERAPAKITKALRDGHLPLSEAGDRGFPTFSSIRQAEIANAAFYLLERTKVLSVPDVLEGISRDADPFDPATWPDHQPMPGGWPKPTEGWPTEGQRKRASRRGRSKCHRMLEEGSLLVHLGLLAYALRVHLPSAIQSEWKFSLGQTPISGNLVDISQLSIGNTKGPTPNRKTTISAKTACAKWIREETAKPPIECAFKTKAEALKIAQTKFPGLSKAGFLSAWKEGASAGWKLPGKKPASHYEIKSPHD